MRKQLVLSWIFLFGNCRAAQLSYTLNGGRLGDNLHTLCRTALVHYITGIPMRYIPFEYSQFFAFSQILKPLEHLPTPIIKVNEMATLNKEFKGVYLCHFYTKTPALYEYAHDHPAFKQLIKQLLTPLVHVNPMKLPADCATIALHVRKGGGFDQPLASEQEQLADMQYADLKWPTKFPPDDFYIEALEHIISRAPDKKWYIFLFTDDSNPVRLVHKYQSILNKPQVQFDCRLQENAHDRNVIEDLFAMTQFDYLIRSSSLYAKTAQLLGSFKAIVSPYKAVVDQKKVIIESLEIVTISDGKLNKYHVQVKNAQRL